jgi:hypothetical protein
MPYTLLIILILNLIAYKIPKKTPKISNLCTVCFSMGLSLFADVCFGVINIKYYYFTIEHQFRDFTSFFLMYPAKTIILINGYELLKTFKGKIFYVVIMSILSMIGEYLLVKDGFFVHHGWKYVYSVICYPILIVLLIMFSKFCNFLIRLEFNSKGGYNRY